MQIGDVLIAGKRVTDQYRIRALCIAAAICLIGDLKWAEIDAGVEAQRLITVEAHHRRMRVIGLARAVLGVECNNKISPDQVHVNIRLSHAGLLSALPAALSPIDA